MKNVFSPFAKLFAVAACALSFASCQRAEYALLPKSKAYLGTEYTHARPAAPTAVAQPSAVTLAPEATAASVASTTPVAATTPAPAPKPAAAATSTATPTPAPAPARATSGPAAANAIASTPAPKPTLLQKVVAKKIMKKAENIASKLQRADHRNTAETAKSGISSNLKLGIVLLIVGAIITLLPGGIFDLIGAVVAIIGLLLILLAILDMV